MSALFWALVCLVLCAPGLKVAPRVVALAVCVCALNQLAVVLPGWWGPVFSFGLSYHWNWPGKLLATALAAFTIYSLHWVSPTVAGLRWPVAGSLRGVVPVVLAFALLQFSAAYANRHHHPHPTAEALWYELTMPGIAEELFYRGVLLGLLGRVFPRNLPFLGTRTSWGGLVGLVLFMLGHALNFPTPLTLWPQTHFTMGILGIGLWGAIFLWVRERTGSVWAAVVAHNLSNICLFAAWCLP